jgi:predicted nucleic acid-binding protein
LLAPGLFEYEVVASLRRMVHQKVLLPAEGEVAFAGFERINVSLAHDRSLHTRAWQLAKHFNQSRTYDMPYLAVAQLNDCAFWTVDERLYNSVRHELAWVHWIGTSAPKP